MALFVPLISYFILRGGGHTGHIHRPESYGIDSILKVKTAEGEKYDTIYHVIKDERFINQYGDTIHIASDFPNKVLVLNFFFTTCTTICPQISANVKKMQEGFRKKNKNDSLFHFYSISVDPKTDTVPQLRRYANKYSLNPDTWSFLTGDKKSIYDFARKELFLKLPEGSGSDNDFIHPNELVLIDKYRNIRGYYNALDSNEISKCIRDMSILLVEKNKIHEKR